MTYTEYTGKNKNPQEPTSASVRKVFDSSRESGAKETWNNLSEYDKGVLISIAGDLASLIASFGGPNLLSVGADALGTATSIYGDVRAAKADDGKVSWRNDNADCKTGWCRFWNSEGMQITKNAGMNMLSLVPGLNAALKTTKLKGFANKVSKAFGLIAPILEGNGLFSGFKLAIEKMQSGEELTLDDVRTLIGATQAVMGVGRRGKAGYDQAKKDGSIQVGKDTIVNTLKSYISPYQTVINKALSNNHIQNALLNLSDKLSEIKFNLPNIKITPKKGNLYSGIPMFDIEYIPSGKTQLQQLDIQCGSKSWEMKDIVDENGNIHEQKLLEYLQDITNNFIFISKRGNTHKLIHPKDIETANNTHHHYEYNGEWKDINDEYQHGIAAATSAQHLHTPYGYTKQEQVFTALMHDIGRMVAGGNTYGKNSVGHQYLGAAIIEHTFPNITKDIVIAISKHESNSAHPLTRATKTADIGNGRKYYEDIAQIYNKGKISGYSALYYPSLDRVEYAKNVSTGEPILTESGIDRALVSAGMRKYSNVFVDTSSDITDLGLNPRDSKAPRTFRIGDPNLLIKDGKAYTMDELAELARQDPELKKILKEIDLSNQKEKHVSQQGLTNLAQNYLKDEKFLAKLEKDIATGNEAAIKVKENLEWLSNPKNKTRIRQILASTHILPPTKYSRMTPGQLSEIVTYMQSPYRTPSGKREIVTIIPFWKGSQTDFARGKQHRANQNFGDWMWGTTDQTYALRYADLRVNKDKLLKQIDLDFNDSSPNRSKELGKQIKDQIIRITEFGKKNHIKQGDTFFNQVHTAYAKGTYEPIPGEYFPKKSKHSGKSNKLSKLYSELYTLLVKADYHLAGNVKHGIYITKASEPTPVINYNNNRYRTHYSPFKPWFKLYKGVNSPAIILRNILNMKQGIIKDIIELPKAADTGVYGASDILMQDPNLIRISPYKYGGNITMKTIKDENNNSIEIPDNLTEEQLSGKEPFRYNSKKYYMLKNGGCISNGTKLKMENEIIKAAEGWKAQLMSEMGLNENFSFADLLKAKQTPTWKAVFGDENTYAAMLTPKETEEKTSSPTTNFYEDEMQETPEIQSSAPTVMDSFEESANSEEYNNTEELPEIDPLIESVVRQMPIQHGVGAKLHASYSQMNPIMQGLLDLFVEEKIPVRVTSGYSTSGHTAGSNHYKGMAFDVVPAAGYTYASIQHAIKNSPRIVSYMRQHNLGYINETGNNNPGVKRTGDNFHFGPDPGAIKDFNKLMNS